MRGRGSFEWEEGWDEELEVRSPCSLLSFSTEFEMKFIFLHKEVYLNPTSSDSVIKAYLFPSNSPTSNALKTLAAQLIVATVAVSFTICLSSKNFLIPSNTSSRTTISFVIAPRIFHHSPVFLSQSLPIPHSLPSEISFKARSETPIF